MTRVDNTIGRDQKVKCPKCYKKMVKAKDEKARQNKEFQVPIMQDQPTVFTNVRMKICSKCKHKIAYYINNLQTRAS